MLEKVGMNMKWKEIAESPTFKMHDITSGQIKIKF